MKFIHTADLHLDAPVRALAERAKVRREALAALSEMIDYAERNQIKYMVIAGDLFDSSCPSAATLGAVAEMMASAQMTFLIAPGNHDAWQGERYCGAEWPDNVFIFSPETSAFSTEEGTFIGVGFYEGMNGHPLSALIEGEGRCVVVTHGSLADSNPLHRIDEGVLSAMRADYVALGHIHKGEDPHLVSGIWVGNPGSPAPHGFDEAGKRSFLEISIEQDGLHWQRIVTQGVRFWEEIIEIRESDSHSDILGRLMVSAARYGEKDIFRFRLRGKTLCSLPDSLEEYPSLAEIIDETTLPFSLEKEAKEQTLRGYFIAQMLPLIDKAPDGEKQKYEAALRLGLEAFE